MNNKSKIVYIILAFWLLVIVVWVSLSNYTLNTGKEVLLKTLPVDPRDLFMGDYVILNYEIAQFPHTKTLDYKYNKQVYVSLDIDDYNVAHIDKISETKPSDNSLFLKGSLSKCQTVIPLWQNGKCIKYGIENYYVKENKGKIIEKNLRNGGLVKVVVDKNGNAQIKGFQ